MIVYTNKINIIKTLIFEKFKDNDKGLDRSVNNGVYFTSYQSDIDKHEKYANVILIEYSNSQL